MRVQTRRTVAVRAGLFAAAAVGVGSMLLGAVRRRRHGRLAGMAHLRSRPRRHALFAADPDHAGQREPAAGRLDLSHEAGGGAVARGRGARAGGDAAAPVGDVPDAPGRGGQGRGRGGSGFRSSEVTPLVVNGTMYIATPYYRVVAVDAPPARNSGPTSCPSGNPSTRGVEYWPGDAQTPAQIVFGSSDGKLYSLDAKTGKPNAAFGDNGIVNLNTPEILQGLPGRDGLSSPPIVYKNLVITGGTTQENPPHGPAGDVRAWDMHTGKLAWTFHSIPRDGRESATTPGPATAGRTAPA